MIALAIAMIVVAALQLPGIIVNIYMIGKPRKTLTAGDVEVSTAINLAYTALFVLVTIALLGGLK